MEKITKELLEFIGDRAYKIAVARKPELKDFTLDNIDIMKPEAGIHIEFSTDYGCGDYENFLCVVTLEDLSRPIEEVLKEAKEEIKKKEEEAQRKKKEAVDHVKKITEERERREYQRLKEKYGNTSKTK